MQHPHHNHHHLQHTRLGRYKRKRWNHQHHQQRRESHRIQYEEFLASLLLLEKAQATSRHTNKDLNTKGGAKRGGDDDGNDNDNDKEHLQAQVPPDHHHLANSSSSSSSSSHGAAAASSSWFVLATSIGLYWLLVSLIPIYNKFYFQKSLYPFPIATAGIQLGAVCLVLANYNIGRHYYCFGTTSSSSWLLGPHLLWKLKWCAPIGILFGFKYGVTNWGLHLLPASTHLLLQSTDLVWTVGTAYVINRERVTFLEGICLVICVAGSVVLACTHSSEEQDHHDTALDATSSSSSSSSSSSWWLAIGINLSSPFLLGLCISTLRLACTELMRQDNCVNGTVTAVELTCLKLSWSSVVACALATWLEPAWFTTFVRDLPTSTQCGVVFGSVFISIFQVNCTWLTWLTNAVTVGLVGQVKIIPQWIAATLFFASRDSQSTLLQQPQPQQRNNNIIGALLIMSSAALYALSNYYNHYSSLSDRAAGGINVHEEHASDDISSEGLDDIHDDDDDDDDENVEEEEMVPMLSYSAAAAANNNKNDDGCCGLTQQWRQRRQQYTEGTVDYYSSHSSGKGRPGGPGMPLINDSAGGKYCNLNNTQQHDENKSLFSLPLSSWPPSCPGCNGSNSNDNSNSHSPPAASYGSIASDSAGLVESSSSPSPTSLSSLHWPDCPHQHHTHND